MKTQSITVLWLDFVRHVHPTLTLLVSVRLPLMIVCVTKDLERTKIISVQVCYSYYYYFRVLNGGSYTIAHVILYLLNKLGKSDKMRGLLSIQSFFCYNFNEFNNTRARMLDSIYHMAFSILWNLFFVVKRYNIVIRYLTLIWLS